MSALELICAAIVAIFWSGRIGREPDPKRFIGRMLLLTGASWFCENTVIAAYGFYHYDPSWHLFIGHVPLAIVLIWPVVVHSAWDLARALAVRPAQVPLLAGAFVLADASLIEPVAVHARLWSWTEPGLFAVPPIGILGWALFAIAAVWCFERRATSTLLFWTGAFVHGALLASWWLLFRWINQPQAAAFTAVTAVAASIFFTTFIWRRKLRQRVRPLDIMLRAPGAAFFFVLLLVTPADPWLWVYACAFVPPYLALLDTARLRREALERGLAPTHSLHKSQK